MVKRGKEERAPAEVKEEKEKAKEKVREVKVVPERVEVKAARKEASLGPLAQRGAASPCVSPTSSTSVRWGSIAQTRTVAKKDRH